MPAVKTADLVDAHDDRLRGCTLQFERFGRRTAMAGPIATVKTFEDNGLVRRCLEQPGEGRVLVVDGAGSLRTALVGDVLAALAMNNGWAGIVVNGAIRDAAELDVLDFAVFALGRTPKRPAKQGIGQVDVVVTFGDVDFIPGHFVYCDPDGVLVSQEKLA